jgi:RNA polymerase sigma-70 factor (ECF subfamily)
MILLVLPDIPTEDRLLALARRGDQRAVMEIYDGYFEPIFQFLRLRVDDPALAEDMAGEVFVRFIAALRGGRAPHHSLRGWLFRVARNVLHDFYGQRRRLSESVLDEWLPAPDHEAPEARLLAALDAEGVRRALGQLSDEQQEVLVLRFGQQLSLQETADVMGKGVGAIKSLQFRATERLRSLLEAG